MTIRRLASTGSNTAPYDTWAKACTSLATVLAASTATGDIIYIDNANVPAADKELAADTTYSIAGNISIICGTQNGASGLTLGAMGTTTWIGNSTTNRGVTLAGAFRAFIYGLTIRTAGVTADGIFVNTSDDGHFEMESCYFWHGNTHSGGFLRFGGVATSGSYYCRLVNCTFRLGNVAQSIRVACNAELVGGSLSSDGSVPSTAVFLCSDGTDGSGWVTVIGGDFSHAGSCALVGDCVRPAQVFRFIQCKLGASFVMLAAQTATNKSSGQVWIADCASGDTHGLIGYADALGSVVSDTGIYFTAGLAAQSWKIVTTAAASFGTPFVTPWLARPNSDVSTSIQPYVEILRDGSATAYQDDEVWIEVGRKATGGSTSILFERDRMAILGTPANQDAGAGTGSWTGEGGTAWSGKVQATSAFAPAEVGAIAARVVVGEPSSTVYADPQIRGFSDDATALPYVGIDGWAQTPGGSGGTTIAGTTMLRGLVG